MDIVSLIIQELDKKHGICATQKQLVIIEEICLNPDFGDAKRLWFTVQKKQKISVATAYNTLSMLVRYGFVRKEKHTMGYKYYLNVTPAL